MFDSINIRTHIHIIIHIRIPVIKHYIYYFFLNLALASEYLQSSSIFCMEIIYFLTFGSVLILWLTFTYRYHITLIYQISLQNFTFFSNLNIWVSRYRQKGTSECKTFWYRFYLSVKTDEDGRQNTKHWQFWRCRVSVAPRNLCDISVSKHC